MTIVHEENRTFHFICFNFVALMSFIFWVSPVHYVYAGCATIMTVCSVGMGSIYYNSLFARLVQSDKTSQEKIRLYETYCSFQRLL